MTDQQELLSPMDALANILQQYMQLPGRVVKYNQGWHAPKDWNLYITISASEPSKTIATKNEFDSDTLKENAYVVSQGRFAVEVISRNDEAITRREEVFMAINSALALRIAEANNLSIWRTGGFVDLSALEGASMLCRYRTVVAINYMRQKSADAEYFDKFRKPEILVEG
ncbi:hypothetical protein NO1_1195 [Candidatus Termititenax aidoneus]|uniref:Uncharacterized protein n=1 Tax=Termititenax aidoneus TaxID=2218524 RepID=A0A388TDG6_TERA1|nr:hypothetical protein NO1_1195 [Candidatus Termititenax aidoneus]